MVLVRLWGMGGIGSMRGMGSASGSGSASAAGVTLPPSGYGAGGQDGGGGGMSTGGNNGAMDSGEPQLVLRNVANVWGKKPAGGGGASSPPTTNNPAAPAPPSSQSSSNNWANSYNQTSQSHTSSSTAGQATSTPVKTEEQIRKERMAAALFGGGATTAPPPTAIARRTVPRPSSAAIARANPTTPTPPPPVPTPVPIAPEVDLLDLMGDSLPVSTPALGGGIDILSPTPFDAPAPALSPKPAPSSPPPAFAADPFAEMDGILSDTPLASLPPASAQAFEYNGVPLAPLKITTAQFGERWGGSCPHTSPISSTAANAVSGLDDFTGLCEGMGAYCVESIRATNEGICAGMLGGGVDMVLIHGKVGGVGCVEVTVKSTDANLSGCLAMYLQNLMC